MSQAVLLSVMRNLILLVPLICSTALAQEQVFFPQKVKGFFGGEKTLKMEATVYKPASLRTGGTGTYPVVIISHGSTGSVGPAVTARPNPLGNFLAGQGYVVVVPMRRGRGQSEGNYTDSYTCSSFPTDGAMEDLAAAVDWVKALPYVDKDRVVLAGASRGGLLSVIYAAQKKDPAVRAVINFVGGWTPSSCGGNDRFFSQHRTPVKALFLYGEQDNVIEVDAGKRYAELSGNAHFISYRAGHDLTGYIGLYAGDMMKYLKEMGLQ
jgi:dienelactone hydrolase